MEIKIELPEWKCENLLIKHGFVVEEVTAYYTRYDVDPYDRIEDSDLHPIKIRVAYSKYARPTELEKEHPMLYVLNDFTYEKVVNNLFNKDLWKILMCK